MDREIKIKLATIAGWTARVNKRGYWVISSDFAGSRDLGVLAIEYDRFTGEKTEIYRINYYLDGPVKIEEGTTFGKFFQHIMNEVGFIDMVYKETMGDTELKSFVKEWEDAQGFKTTSEYRVLQIKEKLADKYVDNLYISWNEDK